MRKKRLLAILATGERSRGELASELGISSQPWLSKAYLSPLMAQGYIAQTLPKKPKSPLQRCRLLRKGKNVLEIFACPKPPHFAKSGGKQL
jgi:predicted ArsR family transcriptional regulator